MDEGWFFSKVETLYSADILSRKGVKTQKAQQKNATYNSWNDIAGLAGLDVITQANLS